VQAILPLLKLLPAFISTILPNNHIHHKNFTLSFTSTSPSHPPQRQGSLNHINQPSCPIQVARASPIVSVSMLRSPPPVLLIPDASQGSLKRSLPTLRSLPRQGQRVCQRHVRRHCWFSSAGRLQVDHPEAV
jgi:hypothetical protein